MNNYIDKYGRYHDKPCIDGKPSSNNGWIYTAYAKKLGLKLDEHSLQVCFHSCLESQFTRLFINRSPGKREPPMSRDEILGLAYLGLLIPMYLGNFNFSPYPIPKFNLIKLIKQVLEVRGKHRNYLWENKLDQLYRFAFAVPLVDRYFILNNTDIKTDIFSHLFYWAVAKIDSLSSKASGIRWLKYGKSLAGMREEFPKDHPLQSEVKNERN